MTTTSALMLGNPLQAFSVMHNGNQHINIPRIVNFNEFWAKFNVRS